MQRLFPNDGDALKSLAQAIVFLANFFGQSIPKFLDEISDVSVLLDPIGGLDAQ